VRDVVAHLACRSAVKFNDELADGEIRHLVHWFERHPEARNCPHGRPIAISLSLAELEAQFQRKK
jgi:DNA mismatch repair protein MutL